MGIFRDIANAIFGPRPSEPSSGAPTPPLPASAAPAMTRAQVEEFIMDIEAKRGIPTNWRTSIVDLLKLIEVDSSISGRRELAKELGYTGPFDGSSKMNVWLHEAVMQKLVETGGKVPPSFKD